MKKRNVFLSVVVLLLLQVNYSCKQAATADKNETKSEADHLAWVQQQLKQPENETILISAHRGDWRNAPENSIQCLKQSIEKRFDIVECDLKLSKDGHLIIMHDKTIDRTTNGKGKPEEYTLAELKQLKLKSALGHVTRHTIPTFEEYLQVAKGKVMLCLDKAFDYFDVAMDLVKKYEMEDQVIYNTPSISLDSLRTLIPALKDNLVLNLLGFPQDTTRGNELTASYKNRGNAIFHPTFSSDTIPLIKWLPSVKKNKLHLWLNGLWPEHNAGHDDDTAVEENKQDETWGWLIEQGATIIQTDRPTELLDYLRKRGLHI